MQKPIKLIFSILLLLLLSACSKGNIANILTADGSVHVFNIEIMDTDETRAKGMMFRQEIAPDFGMLFDFHTEKQVAFWMQNTFIPLDIIFIAADGEIKNIHVNARPHDISSIPSDGKVRFVLEVAGGRTLELGIAKGDKFEHVRIKK